MYEPKQQNGHVAKSSESATGIELHAPSTDEYASEAGGKGAEAAIPALLVKRMSSLKAKFDQVKARREDLRRAQEQSQATLRQSIQAKQLRAAEARKSLWAQERERKRASSGSGTTGSPENARHPGGVGGRAGCSPDHGSCKRLCYLFSRLELMKRQAEHEKRHIVANWKKKKTSNGAAEGEPLAACFCIRTNHENEIKELLECAASCIQNAWIRRRTGRIYRELLLELAPLLAHTEGDATPEQVDSAIASLVANRQLPKKVQQFLSRLNWPFLENGCVSLEDCRYFVTAFYHRFVNGAAVEERAGTAEPQKERRDRISNFERFAWQPDLNNAADSVISSFLSFDFTLKACSRVFFDFQIFREQFTAWQARDRTNLIGELRGFHQDLENLRESVRDQEDYADVWRERIDIQQRKIDERIEQIETNSISFHENASSQSIQPVLETVHQPGVVADHQGGKDTQAPSPPPKSNFNSSIFLFGTFSKQELVHEIFMSSNFRMENFLIQKFNQQSQTSFCSFDEFLQANKNKLYDWIDDVTTDNRTMDVIQYIRTKLFELAPQRGNHRKEIDDFFDIPHLARKLANNLLDVTELLEFSLRKMKQLCAPVRDYEIDALLQQLANRGSELKSIFVGTVQLIDKMTFDMINFLTQTIKPHVIYNVVEYEQSCLSTDWRFSEQDYRIFQRALHEHRGGSEQCARKALSYFYANLFQGTSLSELSLPEVLWMDKERIRQLFEMMQKFSTIGAISIILKSQLGISQETSKPALLNCIFQTKQPLDDGSVPLVGKTELNESTNGRLISNSNSSDILSVAMELVRRQTQDEQLTGCIHRICTRIASHKDTLYELFHTRLLEFCRKQFDYGRYCTKNSGYEPFEREISQHIVEPFDRIFATNFKIYRAYFERLSGRTNSGGTQ